MIYSYSNLSFLAMAWHRIAEEKFKLNSSCYYYYYYCRQTIAQVY